MALPETHAPDDEWAEERVKRLMEIEPKATPPKPGDEIVATAAEPTAETSTDPEPVPAVNAEPSEELKNPASDDEVDELFKAPSADEAASKEDSAAKPEPAEDAVVEDIVRSDSDAALQEQDKAAQSNVVMKPSLWERLKNDWSDWWDDPRKRYITLGVLAVLIGIVFIFPASRAYMMNLVGMRGDISVQVVDSKTTLPLKGAKVEVAGQSASTDAQGKATVQDVKLGDQSVVISKTAFAKVTEGLSVKSGSQTLPTVSLKAVGTQFSFVVTDYVSGKPVPGVEASYNSASAQGSKDGKVLLTIPPTSASKITVTISAENYQTQEIEFSTDTKTATPVSLAPSGKTVFISKQDGRYNLYSADLDGKKRTVILEATGSENADRLALSVSPDGTKAALVSTRDNQKNAQGFLLSTLSVVDTKGGKAQTVEHAESISLLGWNGSKLLYGQTVAGASAANPNRQKIVAYDTNGGKKLPLASANYFNGTEVIGGNVYYATSSSDPSATSNFNKISVDGTGKQVLSNQEYWTLLRTNYDMLSLQTNTSWQTYTAGATGVKPSAAPTSLDDRLYVDNANGSQSLWVDVRDGKGVLLSYDTKTKKDTVLTSQTGLAQPVRWINDTTIVFRVVTPKETADYVFSTAGGQPKKITDTTAVNGITQLRY